MDKPIGPFFLRLIRVFAEALFDDGTPGLKERLDWLMAEYADFSRSVGTKTRLGICGAMLVVQLLPLFVVFRPLPMTWLSKETRRRYLEKLEAGPITFLITALKVPLTLIYFEHPEMMARTGYDGRALVEGAEDQALPATARKARLQVLPAGQAKAVAR
jgi:hypothetical protein